MTRKIMFDLDYSKKAEDISNWIKKTVHGAGFEKVVIALSGGIDSAVAATLAVEALGKENVTVLLLPYGSLSDKGTEDAKDVAKFLELSIENIIVQDVKKTVEEILKQVQDDEKKDSSQAQNDNYDIRKGNIMARVRMIYVYDLAKKLNALVVGTENKSEYYFGYFTRFGDEASDLEPIRNLYKTQVWEMGRFLGLPKKIIEKAPSAGLWEGQSDEEEFGFSYSDADKILYYRFEEKLPVERIVALGFERSLVGNVLQWVKKNDFKHKLPYISIDE